MSGWDDVVESDSHGEFTKFEAGKPVTLHIIGTEPKKSMEHWANNKMVGLCTGADCENCKAGMKKTLRFSVGVFNLTNKRVETLKQGIQVFGQIKNIREAYDGTIDGLDMVITRSGTGALDTEYAVVPVPTKFKPEMMAASETIPF